MGVFVGGGGGVDLDLDFKNFWDGVYNIFFCPPPPRSHLSIDGLTYAKENGVVMLSLPPHCSHRLQPLDRSVYGPLKKHVNSACDSWILSHPGNTMSIYDIPAIVATCLPCAATLSNVIAGFKATGIYPFDRNIFTESDFAPGFITDRPLIVEEQSSLQARSQCIKTSEKPNSSSVNKSPSLASESCTSSNEQDVGLSVGLSQSPGPSGVTNDSQSIFVSPSNVRPFQKAAPKTVKTKRRTRKS